MLEVSPFPEQIRLENTNACNARCVICPREALSRKRGFMDPKLFERIVVQAKGHKITKFTVQGFGEPLLDKNFCRFIHQIKQELGCSTFTVSNAALITPELAQDMVDSGLDKIKVSFYGINKREYEQIHRRLSYEKTVAGIEALVAAKRAARSKMVIRLQYIGRLWRFLPFLLQWIGKTSVGYNTLHNYGDGRAYNKTNGKGKTCPILSAPILQVLWTGEVVPCCYDFNGTMALGDLCRQTIDEIWHGAPYRAIRQAHHSGDFRGFPLCAKCDKRF